MNRETIRILVSIALVISVLFIINKQYTPQPDLVSQTSDAKVACTKTATPSLAEGPYYKKDSPERTNLREVGSVREPLTIEGYVYDKNCTGIAGAWLDFWQADGNGVYDNVGYRLRGHQFTDKDGKYILETVVPGKYPGRTPHMHVKLRANDKSPILITQLFFPGESQNEKDTVFNRNLIVNVSDKDDGKQATFNFVLNSN